MLTIIDSAGNMLTLDDEALTVVEIDSRIHNWRADHGTLEVSKFTVTPHIGVTMGAAFSGLCSIAPFEPPDLHEVHLPRPTSARWEGPAPKQGRGR